MRKILVLFVMFVSLFAADQTIEVINQNRVLPRISVQDGSKENSFNQKMFQMLLVDLKIGSSFEVVENYDKKPFDEDFISPLVKSKAPVFVLKYNISQENNLLKFHGKLVDAKNGAIKFEQVFSTKEFAKWPFLSHKFVVAMAKALDLAPIDWMDNKMLISQYVAPGKSNIMIADYTLIFQKRIISGGLNIFPKWANKNQDSFYFTHYEDKTPTLYKYYLKSGAKKKITSSVGMLVASDVSEDGTKILLTAAPKDQSDIFIYDTLTGTKKQITKFQGIDVSGNFVDDDKNVVFVSDRLGYPNIFKTSINGGPVEQMVYKGKNNNSVTTYKNFVVYSSRENDPKYNTKTFNLYLISTKSPYARQLTANGKNTFPRFSSDGGSIVYIKNIGSQSAVGIIRLSANRIFQFPLKIGKLQSIDW